MKGPNLIFAALLLTTQVALSQTAFYSQNFAGGIPAGWTNGGTDVNGTPHSMWKWTTTGNRGYAATTRLASPTAADGWIIFDSDSLDNGGSGTGAIPGSGPAPGPQRGYLTTTAISCVGHSHVLLQFYDLYYSFEGNTRVVVRNGAGASDTIEANPDYNFTFGLTPNPLMHQYDITSIAANQASVYITLLWDQGYYYYWQVDDISLIDAPPSDLQITSSGSFSYYSTPLSEIQPVSYYADVYNAGSAAQPDSRAAITITKAGTAVFSDMSAAGVTLLSGVDSLLRGTNSFNPASQASPTGAYTTIISAISDSVNGLPYHNADTVTYAISDSVYAVDNGVYGGSFFLYLPADQSASGMPVTEELATIFYLPNADTVSSLSAAFDPDYSVAGAEVQGTVYSLPNFVGDITGGNNVTTTVPVIQTYPRVLTHADLPTSGLHLTTLMIDNNTGASNAAILPAGYYAISMVSVNDSVLALQNGFSGLSMYGFPGGIISAGDLTAYTNTSFILRMNFGHGFDLLSANITRTPSGNLNTGEPVTFTGNTNGDAGSVYSWTVYDPATGITQNYSGRTVPDTFTVPDSVQVCLTVTDGGSSAESCIWVHVIAGPLVLRDTLSEATCYNADNGTVTLHATGGHPPYQYQLGSGSLQTSPLFTGLAPGFYSFYVRDFTGASTSVVVTISAPSQLTISGTVSNTTGGLNNGAIVLTVTGGTPGYTYAWQPGAGITSSSRTGLADGIYTVEVTDLNGCVAYDTFTVADGSHSVVVYEGNENCQSGGNTIVKVQVINFRGIASASGTIEFDPAVLRFAALTQFGINTLTAADFDTTQASNGLLGFAWTAPGNNFATLPDSTDLFAVVFSGIGAPGDSSAISFNSVLIPAQFTDSIGNLLGTVLSGGTVYIIHAAGVDDESAGSINIYPNPASSEVVIDISGLQTDIAEISVTNISGQAVYDGSMSGQSQLAIPAGGWADGFYTVQVRYAGTVLNRKLVVIHQ